MTPLEALALATIAIVAVSFLAGVVRAARRNARERLRAQTEERERLSSAPDAEAAVEVSPPPSITSGAQQNDLPEDETAGYWWRQLFSPKAALGAMLLLVHPLVLLVNVYLLAQTFVIVFDHAPEPLFDLSVMGWNRGITVFDLFALLVTLGQVATGAVLALGLLTRKLAAWLVAVALLGWMLLAGYEVCASFMRGNFVDGAVGGWLSAGLAAGVVFFELLTGAVAIDLFVVPLIMAAAWTLAAPVRGLSRWLGERRRNQRAVVAGPNPALLEGKWASALDSFDSVMFKPLRDLDLAVYDRARDALAGREPRPRASTRRVAAMLAAVGFAGALMGCGGIQVAPSKPPDHIRFYAGVDVSRSGSDERIQAYQKMLSASVLAAVRPGDEVLLFELGASTGDDVTFAAFEGGRLSPKIEEFFQSRVVALSPRSGRKGTYTNIGSALEFVKRDVRERRAAATRLAAGSPRPMREAVILFTDGQPSGRQTITSSEFPEIPVWFFGIDSAAESALRALCGRYGINDSQLRLVRYGGWQSWLKQFGAEIGRSLNTRQTAL